jgi:monofunctional biosynthetic peptidoglycan transglycosylase
MRKLRSIRAWVTRWLRRIVIVLIVFWSGGIVLFSFLPVPFSAVMVERQLSAWLHGNTGYVAHSDWVAMEDISPWMPLAVIAAEDQTFSSHRGFDVAAIRKVLASRGENTPMRGASTLSQQTAKNLLLWDGHSWLRKGLEAGLTAGIELVWSKRRILTVYLNIAEFGEGIFGVEAAARHYFHKPASRLTQAQAARLAAVLPNPIRLKANAPSGYVLARQQWIQHQMRQLGGLTFLRPVMGEKRLDVKRIF